MSDRTDLEIRVARDAELFGVIKQQVAAESGRLLHAPGESRPIAEHEWLCGPATDGAFGIGLLAIQDGTAIGFAEALRQEMLIDCPTADLALGVLQSAQRQGVGRALMEVLESWATQIGLNRLQLQVLPNNHAAIALYEACGFETNGASPRGLHIEGEFCTLLHMGKRLAGDERVAAEPHRADRDTNDGKVSESGLASPPLPQTWTPRLLEASDSEKWRQMQPRLRVQTKWMARTLMVLTFDKATAAEYCAHLADSPRFISHIVEPFDGGDFIGSVTGHFGSYLRDAHILTFGLMVDRAWWGQGVAHALFEVFEATACEQQARRLSSDIAAENHRACAFLERHGFVVDARMPRATTIEGQAMDVLRLSKLID